MDLFKLTHRDVPMDFKLRLQLGDAAQSVLANIAEGYGRPGIDEYLQFLTVGLGSIGEALTGAIGLGRTNRIAEEALEQSDELHYEVKNRLSRLVEKLQRKRDDGDWIARITQEPEEYITPPLRHSITLSPGHA